MSEKIAQLEAELAVAQTPTGRIEALNALARELSFSDSTRAVQLAEQARNLSVSGNFTAQPYLPGLAASLFISARAYNQLGKYPESLACLLEAQPHYESLGDQPGLMWLYNEFGRLHYFLSDYSTALGYYLKELEIANQLNHTNRQAGTLHNIALVYFSTSDYALAIETARQGLAIAEAAQDTWTQAFLLGGLAETYFHLKEYVNALEYGLRSLELARTAGLPGLIHGALVAVSWTHFELGQTEAARGCLEEVLTSAGQSGDKRGKGEALRALGEQAARLGQPAQALPRLEAALSLAEDLGEKAFIASCCLALSAAHTALDGAALALDYYKRYHELDKAVFNEKSDIRMQSLAVIHRLESARQSAEIYQLRNVMLQQEIEERRKAQAALEHLANHDPLTGLLNRRAFFVHGEAALARQAQLGEPAALMLIDLDHFKAVNDQYGHQAGDSLLAGVAHLVRQQLRDLDYVCRYGGEEFAVLLPGVDLATAQRVAERLRQAVAAAPLAHAQAAIPVTISIGVTQAAAGIPANLDQLLAYADLALYAAKRNGRDRVELAGETGIAD